MSVLARIHPVLGVLPVCMSKQPLTTPGSTVMMKILEQAQHLGEAQCPLMAVFILSPTLE